jgi:alpha-L-rhamnosidase
MPLLLRAIQLLILIPALLLSGGASSLQAQSINPGLLGGRWQAQWIRTPGGSGPGVYLFRRTFNLSATPARFVVHASADQRYELFVNGRRMAAGPARGDLNHWRFETVDIGPALKPGPNVVAAIAWNFGAQAPMAQVSDQTGFVLQGDGEAEAIVNTGKEWTTAVEPGWTLLPIDRPSIFYEYFVAGPGEQIDGARRVWGWERGDFDDKGWVAAEAVGVAAPRGIRDSPSRWFLVPRGIPPMEDTPERLDHLVRAEGGQVPAGVLKGDAAWTVPARSKVTALFDRALLTTAYPEVIVSGGRGSRLTITYAEALRATRADGKKGDKGNRSQTEGKVITGLKDVFLPDGGDQRLFTTLWWRTYRYVEVVVETADDPVTIADIRGRFTAYPAELKAKFTSTDPALRTIFDVGWRTVRLCSHETYMDTPYWEQLQYVGDTRIQALVTLYLSGDDRLVRNAIQQFDESRMPDGITQSRYPTELPQLIPPFSLFWIGMQHDLWWFGGDRTFAKRYLNGNRAVLDWFNARLAPSGLLGRLEWWNYADWIVGWPHGEPPSVDGGESVILSLQLALALREAADLEEAVGTPAVAEQYRGRAERLVTAVRTASWDQNKGLVADTPAKTSYSQHANLLAVLADVVPSADQQALMRKVLEDGTLTQATYYFKFYLFRALNKAGLAERYLDELAPWRTMLDLGLTTWAETPEPTRSDSHAWSAHPSLDLLTTVAGITPAEPGFGRVRLRPALGTLTSLDAAVPTPKGEVAVSYRRDGSTLTAVVSLPAGVTGTLSWGGRSATLTSGAQTVRLK